MPTRAKDTKGVDGTGQGRKDSLEKRILTASQTAEAPESLRCPESRRSTSEDSVTQKETELSEKRTEPVISDDNTEQPMAKGCIETRRRRQRRRIVGYGYETWVFWTGTTRPDGDPRG